MRRPNPPVVPADTSPGVWREQMAAIRARSIAERLAEWDALNTAVAAMEAASVRREHPELDEHQVFLTLVRRRYGNELAFAAWPDAATVPP